MLWIARFIKRVKPSNPRIVLISRDDLLPKPDRPVLVVLIIPERGISSRIIRVPVWVLATRDCVHVQDGVNAVFCALYSH